MSSSHGDVIIPPALDHTPQYPSSSYPAHSKPSISSENIRPSKRLRLDPSYDDENRSFLEEHTRSRHRKDRHRKVTRKDEKALMDDLMAGLDASVFDNSELSPVKQVHPARTPRSPLKVKIENGTPIQLRISPVKREPSPHPYELDMWRPQVKVDLDVKVEVVPSENVSVAGVDSKTGLHDEDFLEFDFGLADMSAFDDDLLLKPEAVEVSVARFTE